MRNQEFFKNKKVTVVGLARSGLACANLLYDLAADVSVTDNSDNEFTRLNATKLKSRTIKVEIGKHSEDFIKGRDLIVVSPGVPANAAPILWSEKYKIPLISEVEAAGILCPATIIAITGTNGKTTVTTLIGNLLEEKGKRVFVCGNIGNPFCQEVEKMRADDFVSLEISSFQLERIKTFKPKIALILNISRNHLDRYNNMQEYIEVKKRIFMNQDDSDYLILNEDDSLVRGLAKASRAKVLYFSQRADLNPNYSAVLTVASILGIGKELAMKVFREFRGVEHRLEFVKEINKIKFINDSKSTTVDATVWALNNLPSPIILIAGGREKGNDYSSILELAGKKVKEAVLIGEAKDKIKNALKTILPIDEATTLEEAVSKAFRRAEPGDYVVLSPMCKSFDMFSDYEERGKIFKKTVYDLKLKLEVRSDKL